MAKKRPGELSAGSPCPDCGLSLFGSSMTGRFLACDRGHNHAARVRCQSKGCRRRATVFVYDYGNGGRRHWCADHEEFPR